MMQSAPEKCNYSCAICGHLMPAADVLSGRYDLLEPPNEINKALASDLPHLMDVLATLKREHFDGYAYRGQTKEWPGALLPGKTKKKQKGSHLD